MHVNHLLKSEFQITWLTISSPTVLGNHDCVALTGLREADTVPIAGLRGRKLVEAARHATLNAVVLTGLSHGEQIVIADNRNRDRVIEAALEQIARGQRGEPAPCIPLRCMSTVPVTLYCDGNGVGAGWVRAIRAAFLYDGQKVVIPDHLDISQKRRFVGQSCLRQNGHCREETGPRGETGKMEQIVHRVIPLPDTSCWSG